MVGNFHHKNIRLKGGDSMLDSREKLIISSSLSSEQKEKRLNALRKLRILRAGVQGSVGIYIPRNNSLRSESRSENLDDASREFKEAMKRAGYL